MTTNSSCFSILQLSDLHILPAPEHRLLGVDTEHYFLACLQQAIIETEQGFDLILLTGDLAQNPCLESYQRILRYIDSYKIPCVCLPGNHDDYELMQQVFNSDTVNCRKQVLLDHWQLISLNSQIPDEAGGRLSNQELEFLEYCLTGHSHRYALIALHHHFLETKTPWMDTMILENSDDLLNIADRFPQIKAITTGHIHQIMDIQASHYRVLGSPSTCFQFVPESAVFNVDDTPPGYRVINLYADGRVDSAVIRLSQRLVGLQMNEQGY